MTMYNLRPSGPTGRNFNADFILPISLIRLSISNSGISLTSV